MTLLDEIENLRNDPYYLHLKEQVRYHEEQIAVLEDKVKAEVLRTGQKWGPYTYVSAYTRTTWDTGMLAGLALVYPKINAAKKETVVPPSVRRKP